jgi:hypothetical protein
VPQQITRIRAQRFRSLADDAGNLADALAQLKVSEPDAWPLLVADVRSCLPGLEEIQIVPVGGPGRAVSGSDSGPARFVPAPARGRDEPDHLT